MATTVSTDADISAPLDLAPEPVPGRSAYTRSARATAQAPAGASIAPPVMPGQRAALPTPPAAVTLGVLAQPKRVVPSAPGGIRGAIAPVTNPESDPQYAADLIERYGTPK
jgi:hypothetical protein